MKRLIALLGLAALPALADIKTSGLYSTGVDAANHLLAPGTPDPHYILLSYPADTIFSGAPGSAVVQSNRPGTWVANTSHSQWIGPAENASTGEPPSPGIETCGANCLYDYRTVFTVIQAGDLMGEMWTSDNGGFIALDGVQLPGSDTGTGVDHSTYASWHPFTIPGLAAGHHTLDFVVQNYGVAGSGYPSTNPTGLQVDLVNTNVPEPGSVFLLGSLLLGGLVLRRKLV